MNIAISAALMLKIIGFICVSIVIALVTLAPMNDQPMSRGQKIACAIGIAVAFVLIFDIVTFSMVS